MEQDLSRRGFVLLRPAWLAKHLASVQAELKSTIYNFPDFAPQDGVWGVRRDGVLTNPGSFHNPLSRRLRQCATADIARIVVDLLQTHPTFGMQCVLAPLSVNHTGHSSKDHARYKRKPYDASKIVLVGFANIGQTMQTFTCAPGTHVVRDALSDKPVEVFRQLHQVDAIPKPTDCQDRDYCDGTTIKVRVPPGVMVVHHTTLLVKLETSRTATEAAQHFKWVFSEREQDLSAVRGLLQPTQWAAYYPGDFSGSKKRLAVPRLQAYSLGFDARWRVDAAYGSTLEAGAIKGGRIPPVIGHSLRELNPTYPEYSPPEFKLYTLSRGPWQLGTLRDSFCVRVVLSIDGEGDVKPSASRAASRQGLNSLLTRRSSKTRQGERSGSSPRPVETRPQRRLDPTDSPVESPAESPVESSFARPTPRPSAPNDARMVKKAKSPAFSPTRSRTRSRTRSPKQSPKTSFDAALASLNLGHSDHNSSDEDEESPAPRPQSDRLQQSSKQSSQQRSKQSSKQSAKLNPKSKTVMQVGPNDEDDTEYLLTDDDSSDDDAAARQKIVHRPVARRARRRGL
jgi:hypothetical protein